MVVSFWASSGHKQEPVNKFHRKWLLRWDYSYSDYLSFSILIHAHLYTHAYHSSSLTLTRHAYLPRYIHTYGHLPYGCNDGTKYITQFQATTTTTSSASWHSSSSFIALFHFPLCQAGGIATLDGRAFISYNYSPPGACRLVALLCLRQSYSLPSPRTTALNVGCDTPFCLLGRLWSKFPILLSFDDDSFM